ncbi:MAG: hypothetical protein P8I83_01375 [Paracoccaceae bacterium]|nr:hypothetical protein [Paracoccaceae bacterium]
MSNQNTETERLADALEKINSHNFMRNYNSICDLSGSIFYEDWRLGWALSLVRPF